MITLSPLVPFNSQSKGKQTEQKQQQQQQSIPSSTRTPLLQSLLKVSRQSNSNSVSNHNSYIVSSFDVNVHSESVNPIEELTWSERKVVWSKGGSIFRTYTFKEQEQRVTQAIFATFEVYENTSTNLNEPSPIASTSAQSLDYHHQHHQTFGPFHSTPPPSWTDDPLPLPIHPTPSQTARPPKLERFLVIFLSDIAFAYSPGGSSIPFQLPFHLRRAWALDKGLLLERAQEGGELFDEGNQNEGEMPTLYSLLDPADEIKAVSMTSILKGLFPTSNQPIENPKLSKGGDTEPIQDLKEGIVFVSDRKDGSEPVMVSFNKRSKMISVWSYGKVIEEKVKEKSEKGKEKGTSKDDGGFSLPVSTTASTSKHRQSTHLASSGKRKRRSSLSHPDRIARRTSTTIANPGGAVLEEADLLEVLGDSLGTSMKRQTSTHNNATSVDRRTSVSRNELSITMDRMALSVGAGLGGVGLSGVTGMGEMDREWTIVMERDEERMVSDVYLEKVWELEVPGFYRNCEGVVACVFDSRAVGNTAISTLAISLESTSTALLLVLSRSKDGRLVATPSTEIPARSILPVLATRSNVLDLLYLKSDGEWGLVTAESRTHDVTSLVLPEGNSIVSLDGDRSRAAILGLDDGSKHLAFTSQLPTGLPLRCLHVLSEALPLDFYLKFLSTANRIAEGPLEMDSIARVLRYYFGIEEEQPEILDPWTSFLNDNLNSSNPLIALLAVPSIGPLPILKTSAYQPADISQQDRLSIIMALHLLAEDSKLSIDTQPDYQVLSELILSLAGALELEEWIDAYRRIVTSVGTLTPKSYTPEDATSAITPVNLVSILRSILAGQEVLFSTTSLASVTTALGIIPSNFYGPIQPLAKTLDLLTIYRYLSPASGISNSALRAQNATLKMDQLGWTLMDISRLSFGIAIPLREALRLCQLEAPENWRPSAYELISRPDLAKQVGGESQVNEKTIEVTPAVGSIDSLCSNPTNHPNSNTTTLPSNDMTVVHKATRFNEDRRLEEVGRMLQFSEPVTVGSGERTLDQLTPQVQQSVLLALSNRTLALPVGFAMFNYQARSRIPTESVPILRINTSARILPMASPIALVEKDTRDGPTSSSHDRNEWPDFHSGVAAALAQHAGTNKIDSAQISFNRPSELDARHAGFLMGLGLVGDISAMAFNQAFEYLKMKHDPTSIGLLLALAVTYVGTSDPKVTSLLSVHLTALHPPGSSALNVSGITQAAGLVGIGLLYLGTQRRTLSDIMVRELCSIKVTSIEDPTACREAYALSAGFAFGMINLGKGRHPSAISTEVSTLRTFRGLILGGSNHPLPGAPPSVNTTDVNITSSAATIAIGLMYLRTERQDVADMLEIPDTARRLDYVRSDLLLLRTLSRSIIMWKTISASNNWVESHIPKFILEALILQEKTRTVDGELDIARWNIVAGACFAVGLKFAGTAAAEAHATLIHYLDRLTRAAFVKAATVQSKIKRHAIRCCLSVVAISLSMVMAGTGEINCLRRLRVAHGQFSEGVTYGTHLASHMALGILFVGSGLYTLGSSNCAVAAMLLAFYPSFPSTATENRAHLQAYRHLWVLAVEPRCLQVKDVDTNEAAFLPVRLRLIDEKTGIIRSKALVAPTLIPDIKLIESIQIDSPRYWSFNLNLISNSIHLNNFLRDGTIYVKRRTGHLSYAQDPRGIRSIFTRSKSETGSSVFDLGEMSRYLAPSAGGLRDFVEAFSDDNESIEAVRHLCLPAKDSGGGEGVRRIPSAFEAFSASVLLECLTRDKKDTIGVYQAIYQAFYQLFPESSVTSTTSTTSSSSIASTVYFNPNYLSLLGLEQLTFLIDFYSDGTYQTLFGKQKGSKYPTASGSSSTSSSSSSSIIREPLIQSIFLTHLRRKIKESLISTFTTSPISPSGDINFYTSLDQYLLHNTWPTSPRLAQTLSSYLLTKSVPTLQDLKILRELVQSNSVERGGGGGGGNQEEEKEGMKLVLRSMGKGLEEEGGKKWTPDWSDYAVEVWSGGVV